VANERGRLSWQPLSFQTKYAMSLIGTTRTSWNVRLIVANGGKVDMRWTARLVAIDPRRTCAFVAIGSVATVGGSSGGNRKT
jgi:hypothetical protein